MCRMWQLSGIPCVYLLATYCHMNRDPVEELIIALGWILKEIHVTWTQFGKKRDKITTLHEEAQKLHTDCGDGVRISSDAFRICSDGVKILVTTSELNRLKEALEDLAE
ncbi:hypothetical protein Tco_1572971 [Tanacetum coccineum]